MPIDHDSSAGLIKAPIVRLKDKGDGVEGVIFLGNERQSTDWQTRAPKTWPDGNPVMEYVLNIAATSGQGFFTLRDEEGDSKKGSDGKNLLDRRKFNDEDVCITTNWSLYKACRSAKVNEGQRVRIQRLSPAGAAEVEWSVTVLEKGLPLERFTVVSEGGITHEDDGEDEGIEDDEPF